SPGDLPDPGIDPEPPALQANSLQLRHQGSPEGNSNPLQDSCLGNSMDREAWWATDHGLANSWTQLGNQQSPEQVLNSLT
ncbi:hypothetical protein D4L84_09125, partial [Campylobacter coli]